MDRNPESEANYKAYQQQYHADRNARARYAYETSPSRVRTSPLS